MTPRAIYPFLVVAAVSGCAYQTPTSLYREGQLEAQQGHISAALAALSAAIKEDPRFVAPYVARATIYKQQGRVEEAAQDYEQVVRLTPYDFSANFELGNLYQQLRKFVQAIAVFRRAVSIRPDDAQANMDLAMCYMQAGQPLQGLLYAQHAVQIDDKAAAAYVNLGVLYAHCQDRPSAIEAFKHALELDPRQPEAYLDLGQEYYSTGVYEQARNVLETARSLAPSAAVSERLGATYYHLRQFDKAEAAYRDALRLDSHHTAALNGLGAVLMSQAVLAPGGNAATAGEARELWKQSLALDKNQPAIENLLNQYTPRE